jgi:predicted transcriptional regulator
MKDTMTFSEHLQAKIDQINRRQERNRKAMMDAIRRVEQRNAIEREAMESNGTDGLRPSQFFEPSEIVQMRAV